MLKYYYYNCNYYYYSHRYFNTKTSRSHRDNSNEQVQVEVLAQLGQRHSEFMIIIHTRIILSNNSDKGKSRVYTGL